MRAAKSWRLLAVLAVGTQAWLLRAPPAVPLGSQFYRFSESLAVVLRDEQ